MLPLDWDLTNEIARVIISSVAEQVNMKGETMNPLCYSNPNYILSTAHLRTRDEIRTARDILKYNRQQDQKQRNAETRTEDQPAQPDLIDLITEARRTRSKKRLAELKVQIEALTGHPYHLD